MLHVTINLASFLGLYYDGKFCGRNNVKFVVIDSMNPSQRNFHYYCML